MEKELHKILYKILPFVLCICIVSGAAAPAYASPTTPDLEAQYLWDLSWTTSSNPSGKNNSWYGAVRILLKDIFDKLSLVQSDQRNLWTYNSTSYRLKNFTDTTSLSESYYINNGAYPMSWLLNSMANLSQNTGYTANQFYNSNSNLNKAISAIVSLNQNFQDYTTVLNNIKSNTDNLSGIKTDTSNLSGIKTDTSNLSGIKTDTSNLSGIKTDTANIIDIKTLLTSRNSLIYYYNSRSSVDSSFTNNTISQYSQGYAIPYFSNDWSGGRYVNSNINATNPSIYDLFKAMNYNLVSLNGGLFTPLTVYNVSKYNDSAQASSNIRIGSLADFFKVFSDEVIYRIANISYMIADADTIAAKRANASQEQSVLTNFTGSGAASASVSDFGAVKDSMVSFKAGFIGGASSSDTFGFLSGDSNAWDWFTQDTANDVDRTQRSNSRLLRSSSSVASDTPLLDSYYISILSILGGDE